MDLTQIASIISQLGFPIAVCIMCFWYIKKLNEDHKEEVKQLSEAIQNNTLVMQQIVDHLKG